MASRCVVFVHAHPDDETLGTGGTIARYGDEGTHVVLVTCTNGEEGEIADVPDLGTIEEIRPRLGEIRKEELAEACRLLGKVDLRMLDFHDSGMDGTPENDAAHAFVNQDRDAVVAKVVEIYQDVRPQVVVTYNAFGGYGHPDHVRAHEAAVAAAEICDVPKLYYTAFPKSLMLAGRDMFGDDFFSLEDIERIGTDDSEITTVVDVAEYVERKVDALKAHRTQLGTIAPFLAMPEDIHVMALGAEHYVLAHSTLPAPSEIETDLFQGIE